MAASRNRDAGYTLAEMLVTIIMFSLVAGAITTVVITSLKHQTSLADRGSALASVRNALEQVDRDIRSALPICSGTTALGTTPSTNEITMYERFPTSRIVDYSVIGTNLVYTSYNTTLTTNSGPSCSTIDAATGLATTDYEDLTTGATVTRTILRNLVNTATQDVFSAGAVLDTCTSTGNNPSTVGAVNIQSLTVTLSMEPTSLSSPVTASDCGTELRNYAIPVPIATSS